jgi:hypothetical protein
MTSCGKIGGRKAAILSKKLLVAVASLTLAISGCGGGGHATISVAAPPPPQTSQSLANQPPDSAGLGCLLTDGSVMFQGNPHVRLVQAHT